jgi:hypothetical protein
MRKLHFMLRARAMAFFPGGFGTLDELFEGLTLRQTERMQPLPIVMFGKEYWDKLIDFDYMARMGTISPRDYELIRFFDSPKEGWNYIQKYYESLNNT